MHYMFLDIVVCLYVSHSCYIAVPRNLLNFHTSYIWHSYCLHVLIRFLQINAKRKFYEINLLQKMYKAYLKQKKVHYLTKLIYVKTEEKNYKRKLSF